LKIIRRNRASSELGQTLAEFAMIAPLLFIMIFCFVDIARFYNAWVTIQGSAREGARYGVTGQDDCPGISDNRTSCIDYYVHERADALANEVDVTVRSWDYPAYSNPAVENNPGVQCDLLEVEVDYDFVPSTPLFSSLFGPLSIGAKERLVNEPWNDCT
jgi:Flp pilus assembly protein TadG